MMNIRDYGYVVGTGKPGPHNKITDVPGVRVGQCTIDQGDVHTGVTVIFPCEGTAYEQKPVAASYVLNGYGKTAGTIQVDELGCIEAPIALTNTLNVGKVMDAMVGYVLREEKERGITVRSVNVVVGETNDSQINDISARAVGEKEVLEAIHDADRNDPDFEQGDVGAGRSTICCDLKGGIGSSSRVIRFNGKNYTIGALVQSNFGSLENLTICGHPMGQEIQEQLRAASTPDVGSIMMVIGTDLPLSARQLKRFLKRAVVGLVRTGSYMGTGSGDVVLGFTNGNLLGDCCGRDFTELRIFPEERINRVFTAAAEAVEEAILNSLSNAHPAQKLNGETVHALSEFLQPMK